MTLKEALLENKTRRVRLKDTQVYWEIGDLDKLQHFSKLQCVGEWEAEKEQTCAEVAKEYVLWMQDSSTVGYKHWPDKFKSCTDFPREPEVVEFEFNGKTNNMLMHGKLNGKNWRVVATEIVE